MEIIGRILVAHRTQCLCAFHKNVYFLISANHNPIKDQEQLKSFSLLLETTSKCLSLPHLEEDLHLFTDILFCPSTMDGLAHSPTLLRTSHYILQLRKLIWSIFFFPEEIWPWYWSSIKIYVITYFYCLALGSSIVKKGKMVMDRKPWGCVTNNIPSYYNKVLPEFPVVLDSALPDWNCRTSSLFADEPQNNVPSSNPKDHHI